MEVNETDAEFLHFLSGAFDADGQFDEADRLEKCSKMLEALLELYEHVQANDAPLSAREARKRYDILSRIDRLSLED